MKTLITSGKNDLFLHEVADLTPGAGQVVAVPILVGVCGTDLEIINGKINPDYVRYPATIGHEWVGRITQVGDQVDSDLLGKRIVVEGIIPCMECFECVAGSTNRCITYSEIGFTLPGAGAEQVLVPLSQLHVVNDEVSNESAVLVEPTSVVTQGFLKVNPKQNSKVLIIGDGTIALIAARLIRTWNPSLVHMLGLKSEQGDLARHAGADEFLTEPVEMTYDLIVDASGAPSRISDAINQLVRGGSLLLIGFTGFKVPTTMYVDDIVNGDVNIFGSFSYSRKAWKQTVELLNSGKLDLSFLITHRFAFTDFATAVEALRSAPAPRGKIVMEIGL
ncbi:MAG: alcohol dehydrogenase catalytic domain-containing protein [Actinobacteria bacterium]|nr:alcohol dehydrogenase catalytic domain-containing protein [Actinomycetota bacterium]